MSTHEAETPLADLLSFQGRNVVITGGSYGIGAAIVDRFIEAGANVFSLDRAARSSPLASPRRHEMTVDVVDEDALRNAIAHVKEKLGRVDVYINNAGAAPRARILKMSSRQWDDAIALNLRAAFIGSQAAAMLMVEQRSGVILNMLSSCVTHVGGNPAHYRAAKAGLLALTQSMATELGPRGIRVVGIAPTLTDTEQVRILREQGLAQALDSFAQALPLGRACTPDEVARVCVFAASPCASFITGSAIFVDGGENAK